MNAEPRKRWVLTVLIALGLLFVCRGDDASGPEDPPPAFALDVDYTGCTLVELGAAHRCVFDPKDYLRLWIQHPTSAEVNVLLDGEPWPSERTEVDGMEGFRLAVVLPKDTRLLSVEVPVSSARWSLAVRSTLAPSIGTEHETSDEVDRALGRAYILGATGRLVEALELLEEIETLASQYPKGRADLATYRGVIYWWQGRLHDAATSLREGVSFAVRLRDPELVRDAMPVYAGVLAELGYWSAAVSWADRALEMAQTDPELFSCPQMGGLLSTVGYIDLLVATHENRRPEHAIDLLEAALQRIGPKGRCPDEATVPAVTLSMANALLASGDPAGALERISALSSPYVATFDERLRLAEAELIAREQLGQAPEQLEQGLEQLREAAEDAGTAEAHWRFELRRGDIRQGQGRLTEAEDAYRRAENASQRLAELAAVGVGRDASVSSHAASTERLAALLGATRPEAALCTFREAQARRNQAAGRYPTKTDLLILGRAIEGHQAAQRRLDEALLREAKLPRSHRNRLRREIAIEEQRLSAVANEILRARSTWRPSCKDLVVREAGELLLGIYPTARGWVLFVQDDHGTELRSWSGPGPHDEAAVLGAAILDPIEHRLEHAQRIRVLASGRAQEIDVHLLPWEGQRLIEHVPVVYGTELPRIPPRHRAPRMLLVADPTQTLPMVPQEARLVREQMAAQYWEVDAPEPAQADPARILKGLEEATFFYFTGHGEHDVRNAKQHALPPYAGGTRGWPARLQLLPPTTLDVHEILMLRAAPEHVALLGCETGVPSGGGGGMSLALAFLTAGANEVVASPVEVSDTVSFDVGVGLMRGVSDGQVSLSDGLRRADNLMRQEGRDPGRYRVLVR